MRSLIFHLFSLSLLATSLAGCQLLVDNRAEGTTPVVVVTTDQWDMKVKAEHDYALKPELEALPAKLNLETKALPL